MPETAEQPARRGRWLGWVGASLIVLCLIQVGTYLGCACSAMPVAGITHLADFGCIRGCEYAAIDKATWGTLDAGQRSALEGRLRRHVPVIYHSHDEIPDHARHFAPLTEQDRRRCEESMKRPGVSPENLGALKRAIESGRKEVGLNKGIRFSWKLEGQGLFWMKCSSGCYMGLEGAEGGSDLYVWVLFRWVRIRNYGHQMA